MKIRYISVFLVLILICASCGCTDSGPDGSSNTSLQVSVTPQTPQVPVISVETRNYTLSELQSFVINASEYAKKAGIEQAAEQFNDPSGDFVDGTMYIYALYNNGTYIAEPFDRSLVGTNGLSATDTNGMRFVEACRDVAESGGGFILYTSPNPSDNMTSGEKLGYVYPVDDNWWIGSGIYLDDLVNEYGETPYYLAYEKLLMAGAASFAGSVPMDEALSEFSSQDSDYFDYDNGMYVIAIDYEGNIIAHPGYQEIIGENIYDREMKYGVKSIRRASEIARNGGGFLIYSYEGADGTVQQNLNYVLPVEKDDYWIISSGITLTQLQM